MRSAAAAPLRIKIVSHIDQIPPGDWRRVYPEVLENYSFFKSLQESNLELFEWYYILVYEEEALVGVAPCFLMHYPLETTVQGPLKPFLLNLKKKFPHFLELKVLICGMPMGAGHLGIRGDLNRVFEAILKGLNQLAGDKKVSILAFKDFGRAYTQSLDRLQGEGFYKFESLPSTEMDIRFSSFEHYLTTLSGATRYDLKRKFKKVDGHVKIEMEVTNNLNGALDEVFALFSQTEARGEIHFEKIPKVFFEKLASHMPGEAKYFLWRMNGKLVAFTLCLVSGERLIDYYLGLDYSVAHPDHLYFVRFRDLMNWCI